MKTQRAVLGIVGAVLTLVAFLASAATDNWEWLVLWLFAALIIAFVFAIPSKRPGPAYDAGGSLVTCPNCGGTTFFAVRSSTGLTAGFLVFGWLGALLAPRSQIRCAACGASYPRAG